MAVCGNAGESIVVGVLRVYISCIGIKRRKMAGIFCSFFKKIFENIFTKITKIKFTKIMYIRLDGWGT